MQRSLQLEDQITTLRQQNSTELTSLQRQLLSDMSLCALELDAIITVCLQSANGDEPNLSCLLSIPSKLSDAKRLNTLCLKGTAQNCFLPKLCGGK